MRVLERIQRWRYGAIGSAAAAGLACFGVAWTIVDAAGAPGSPFVLLLLFTLSMTIGFAVFHHLRVRHLLLVQRSSPALTQGFTTSNDLENGKVDSQQRIIGIVAPISSWSTMFYVNIVKGIREAADREREDLQRRLLVIDVPREEFTAVTQAAIRQVARDIDGIISINIRFPEHICQQLAAARIPVVNVHHEQSGVPFVVSLVPEHNAFEKLMEHLFVEKECSTGILVTKGLANPFKDLKVDPFRKEKRDIYTSAAKLRGLNVQRQKYLIELDQPLLPGNAYILEIDRYIPAYGEELFERIADSCPRSSAIVCLADGVAIGFLKACSRTGVTAEARGLRVSGFDNSPAAEWLDLTSVDYELSTIGHLAYNRMQTAIEHPGIVRHATEFVKTRLVLRGSTNW